ncbi:MAG TPA: STAS domain-containing protein [Solirubrobacteraceae bacterium]|nr:STAS domain-containing protein [Solirubrobacteraceae bacterium]
MQNDFRVDVRVEGRIAIIGVTGELDLASSPELEQQLDQVWRSDADQLVLDLRGLEFMDSTGLSIVVGAHQRVAETGRKLSVVKGPPQVQRLLDLTGVSERLQLVDTPEEVVTGG